MAASKMAIAIMLLHATAASASVIADTEFGKVEGQQKIVNGVTVKTWLGVPFGDSPKRWTPPTNPKPWSSVKRADTAFKCLQRSGGKLIGNEKTCLQVNIYVPVVKTGKPINNVMAYIPGGSNYEHSPAEPVTEGSRLAARSTMDGGEPVIVMNIGYRVGGLGFMAMPELTAESSDNSSGNYGILDQILALKWIKRNIHAFGGSKDPRLTIFGNSAGAYNVATLLSSPLATGLFDAAIMQSTYHGFHHKTLALSEKTGTACAAKHNCANKDAKDTLACMRALSVEQAYDCMAGQLGTTTSWFNGHEAASVDGHVLKCTPMEALLASGAGSTKCGKLSQAPIIIGATSKEGTLFASTMTALPGVQETGQMFAQNIIDNYGSGKEVGTHDFTALYPVKRYEEDAAKLQQFYGPIMTPSVLAVTDMFFSGTQYLCSTLYTAAAIAAPGSSRKAYIYMFDQTPSNPVFSLFGATHTAELPYIFGTFGKYFAATSVWTPNAHELQLSQIVMDYWLNFARYSNPNSKGTDVTWPAAGCGGVNNFITFGKDGAVASIGKPYQHHKQCPIWHSFTGLPVSTCDAPKFAWKVSYPSCTRGYWASGCGQPAIKQKGTVKCFGSKANPVASWEAKDADCTGKRPTANERACPATKPCPRCKGCKRDGGCWKSCGNKAGKCSSCDSRGNRVGACCRRGAKDDPIECKLAEFQFASDKVHTCALLPADMHIGYLFKNILGRLKALEDEVEDLKK